MEASTLNMSAASSYTSKPIQMLILPSVPGTENLSIKMDQNPLKLILICLLDRKCTQHEKTIKYPL